jgi:hypothetical protein
MALPTLREMVVDWIAEAFPQLFYGSIYEFRVLPSSTAGRLDLAPVKTKLIGPQSRVYQWTLAGAEPTPAIGTSVVLAFLDADETRPVVLGYAPLRAPPGALPTALKLDCTGALAVGPSAPSVAVGVAATMTPVQAVGHFVRYGDEATLGAASGTVTLTATAPVSTGKS